MVNLTVFRFCFLSLVLYSQTGFTLASTWIYDEDTWPEQCKTGSKQSPINLAHDISENEQYSSLIFEEYDEVFPAVTKNNGHSFEVRLYVEIQPRVKGGGLPSVYVLDHLHFHWESEHTIEDVRYPLELHHVYYASQYGNLSEALKYTGGVTVFSVLFYLSPDDDEIFQPLTAIIDKIQDKVNAGEQMRINVADFLPRDRAGFYRYNGSLTTPGCNEGVIWTVFTNKLPISSSQVKEFPLLRSENHTQILKNYRSLQKLNGRRIVLRASPISESSASLTGQSIGLFCVSSIALLLKEIVNGL